MRRTNTVPITLDSYGENEYFAFLESLETFDPATIAQPEREWWWKPLQSRREADMPAPSRIAWLDCVSASYFASLDWRDEEIERGGWDASSLRRARLNEMSASAFVVVPLLLSFAGDECDALAGLSGSDWHRITIDIYGKGLPVLVAADYGRLPDAPLRWLHYVGECGDLELRSLRSVFNLDFLPDGSFGGDEGGEAPRPAPEPTPGAAPATEIPLVSQRISR
jgi:hypothetical protein